MTFLHSGLLLGLLLTAIPIALHLLLRQKPKRLDFPALRLVKSRTKRSSKRLRLRHLLLLALRILLVAGMVFAAARPLLPAADWSLRWWDWAILVGILGAAVAAARWWRRRVAAEPGQLTRDQLKKRGRAGIWGIAAALAALLVGWPYATRVSTSMKDAPSAEALDLPVAGVFVFDVSASMTYRQGGQTLLDVGRQIVADHVGALPAGSRVAVTDNASDSAILFQVSLSSVPAQLERLTTAADASPLNVAIANAFEAQTADRERIQSEGDNRDRFVRRVYVVTDMAKSAWQFPDTTRLEETLAAETAPGLFVLDVGSTEPNNRGLGALDLSTEELPRGGSLRMRTPFQTTNDEAVPVELYLADEGEPARVAAQDADKDGQTLTFVPTLSTESSALEGSVRLASTDPLAIDDVRYFTVGVTPLPKLLLIADEPEDLDELTFALSGDEETSVPSRYEVSSIRSGVLSKQSLETRDVVCLVNVGRLQDRQWSDLNDFVRAGGGLAVFLGSDSIEPFSYNRSSAQDVLAATLDVYGSRPKNDQARLVFSSQTGPFVDRLAAYDGAIAMLETTRVRRFWRVKPQADARVVARLTVDALPAFVSRPVGQGLSVMFTTAADIKPRNEEWSNLMQLDSGAYWPTLVFCDQLMRHLARVGAAKRNFVAGEIPSVELPEGARDDKLLLRTPDLRNLPVAPPSGDVLPISDARVPGHYSVTNSNGDVLAAFSVNYAAEESDLKRATEDDLASVFGEDAFQLARGLEELNEDIDVARFGQEAFPVLVLLAILFFVGETLLSSRFYGDAPESPAADASRVRQDALQPTDRSAVPS